MEPVSIRSSRDLARLWHGQNVDFPTLYDGKKDGRKVVPNADERQDELIQLAVNIALETALFLELERHTSVANLERMELIKPGGGKFIQEYLDGSDHSREAKLQLIETLRKEKKIRTHQDLCDEKDMAEYHAQVDLFRAALDDFVDEVEEYRDGLIDKPDFPKVQNPVDPRVEKFNKEYGNILKFHDSGAKNRSRTLKKSAEKGNFWQIKDINRLTVVPRTPEIADIYTDLLADRKLETSDKKPNGKPISYIGPWKMGNTCLVDKKCYVVLTRGFNVGGASEEIPSGSVAEIKIEGPEMFKADQISHRCYRVTRMLAGEGGFNARTIVNEHQERVEAGEGEKSRFARLSKNVERVRRYYNGLGYDVSALPEIGDFKSASAGPVRKAFEAILKLNRDLFLTQVRAMKPDNPWKRVWLEAAYTKHAELTVEKAGYQQLKEGITDKARIQELDEAKGRVEHKKRTLPAVASLADIARGMPNAPRLDSIVQRMKEARGLQINVS